MSKASYMKLVNVPIQMLLKNDNYVLGFNDHLGKITGFSSIPDGNGFQLLINITWSDGREATYGYPDDVSSLRVDKSMHTYNLSRWIKFNVNRLNRQISTLKKSAVPPDPYEEQEDSYASYLDEQ